MVGGTLYARNLCPIFSAAANFPEGRVVLVFPLLLSGHLLTSECTNETTQGQVLAESSASEWVRLASSAAVKKYGSLAETPTNWSSV